MLVILLVSRLCSKPIRYHVGSRRGAMRYASFPPFRQTQMACYIRLILVSRGKPQQDISATTEGRYSIVSVAVAMYLMASIAAVDLTAGIALLIERRTISSVRQRGANVSVQEMNGVRWLQRKVVGLTLISSFGLLAAASITVLFKSSFEDVDLVVGAAAVLFIADVVSDKCFLWRSSADRLSGLPDPRDRREV